MTSYVGSLARDRKVLFLSGALLSGVGMYALLERATVHVGYWSFFGDASRSFGLTLLPVLAGIAGVVYDRRSRWGWGLVTGGLLAIVMGIVANFRLTFESTGLTGILAVLGLLAGGIGMILRSVSSRVSD